MPLLHFLYARTGYSRKLKCHYDLPRLSKRKKQYFRSTSLRSTAIEFRRRIMECHRYLLYNRTP